MNVCPFCKIETQIKVTSNEYFYAIYDKYPVNPGHLLIISHRHVLDYFSLDMEEKKYLDAMITEAKDILDKRYKPDGYNIGVNCREAAGQTIFHFHLHIIPRYRNDVPNPKGGVRNLKQPIVPYNNVDLL